MGSVLPNEMPRSACVRYGNGERHRKNCAPNTCHPDRKSRDPAEVIFELTRLGPSTAVGMTCFYYCVGAVIVSTAMIPAINAITAMATAMNRAVRAGSRSLFRVRKGEALAK